MAQAPGLHDSGRATEAFPAVGHRLQTGGQRRQRRRSVLERLQLSSGPTDGNRRSRARTASFTYPTPRDGFNGTDSFTYTLTDNLGYTSAPETR